MLNLRLACAGIIDVTKAAILVSLLFGLQLACPAQLEGDIAGLLSLRPPNKTSDAARSAHKLLHALQAVHKSRPGASYIACLSIMLPST